MIPINIERNVPTPIFEIVETSGQCVFTNTLGQQITWEGTDPCPENINDTIFLPIVATAPVSPYLLTDEGDEAQRIGCPIGGIDCIHINFYKIKPEACPILMYIDQHYSEFNGIPFEKYATMSGRVVVKITRFDEIFGLQVLIDELVIARNPDTWSNPANWNIAVVCAVTVASNTQPDQTETQLIKFTFAGQ